MPKSRNRPKPKLAAPARQRRWDWRRVASGLAEFFRNIALLAVGTPLVEPIFSGSPIDWTRALAGGGIGLAVLIVALIFDHERSD